MGQGLFGAIGFGATLTDEQASALFEDTGYARFKLDEEPRTGYESENKYAAYLIFDASGYTRKGHGERYAVTLDALVEDICKRYPDAYAAARKKWLAFVEAARKLGVELPPNGMLYVHDYD